MIVLHFHGQQRNMYNCPTHVFNKLSTELTKAEVSAPVYFKQCLYLVYFYTTFSDEIHNTIIIMFNNNVALTEAYTSPIWHATF